MTELFLVSATQNFAVRCLTIVGIRYVPPVRVLLYEYGATPTEDLDCLRTGGSRVHANGRPLYGVRTSVHQGLAPARLRQQLVSRSRSVRRNEKVLSGTYCSFYFRTQDYLELLNHQKFKLLQ